MSHTVTFKSNTDVLLLYGQNRLPWPNLARHLWLIPAKDVPRCKVGTNVLRAMSSLQYGMHLAGSGQTALAERGNLYGKSSNWSTGYSTDTGCKTMSSSGELSRTFITAACAR